MNLIEEPADPDCPHCHGSGTCYETRPSGATSSGEMLSIRPCGCRSYANRAKVRQTCDHVYVCIKCGCRESKP